MPIAIRSPMIDNRPEMILIDLDRCRGPIDDDRPTSVKIGEDRRKVIETLQTLGFVDPMTFATFGVPDQLSKVLMTFGGFGHFWGFGVPDRLLEVSGSRSNFRRF
jgi:hypothetical protein